MGLANRGLWKMTMCPRRLLGCYKCTTRVWDGDSGGGCEYEQGQGAEGTLSLLLNFAVNLTPLQKLSPLKKKKREKGHRRSLSCVCSQPWHPVLPGPSALLTCPSAAFLLPSGERLGPSQLQDLELGRDLSICPMLCSGPRLACYSQPRGTWPTASG